MKADTCDNCDKAFIGLSGSTKWCPYCGAKHEGSTVDVPAIAFIYRSGTQAWDLMVESPYADGREEWKEGNEELRPLFDLKDISK